MTTLRGRAPKDSFNELLKLQGEHGEGLTSELVAVGDGSGQNSPLKLSTTKVSIDALAIEGKDVPSMATADAGEVLMMSSTGDLVWGAIPKAIVELPVEVTYEYNAAGMPITVTSAFADYVKVEVFEYNAVGDVITMSTTVDGSTRVETITYNDKGLVIKKTSTIS